jgi:hypothetical protein
MFIGKFANAMRNSSSLYKFRHLLKENFEFMSDKSCNWLYFVKKINSKKEFGS